MNFSLDLIFYLKMTNEIDTNSEVLKFLAEKGILYIDDEIALNDACHYGNFRIVKYLVEKGVDVRAGNNKALISASRSRYFEIVKFLVEKGADIHAQDDCALREASWWGSFEIVKYLVENGANIHARYDLALFLASYGNEYEIVKYLIRKGADRTVIENEKSLNYLNIIEKHEIKIIIRIQRRWRSKKFKLNF